MQIVLYDENVGPCRSISKFADQAYCGTFRGDGKLLAAGDESGAVQVCR